MSSRLSWGECPSALSKECWLTWALRVLYLLCMEGKRVKNCAEATSFCLLYTTCTVYTNCLLKHFIYAFLHTCTAHTHSHILYTVYRVSRNEGTTSSYFSGYWSLITHSNPCSIPDEVSAHIQVVNCNLKSIN